jgi:hypothetical protein
LMPDLHQTLECPTGTFYYLHADLPDMLTVFVYRVMQAGAG